jgi:hypothetical protein
MAFPASNQNLADAYRLLKGRANDVRTQSVSLRAASLAGAVAADRILNYASMLARSKVEMTALAATPGLATYAQAQENNGALNIATEYNTMVAQIDATVAWIVSNFPQDGGGFKLAFTMANDGTPVYRTFDTASLATFRTALDALITTIS